MGLEKAACITGSSQGREVEKISHHGQVGSMHPLRGRVSQGSVCPQELEKQYSPSRWVIRMKPEEVVRNFMQIGSQGTVGLSQRDLDVRPLLWGWGGGCTPDRKGITLILGTWVSLCWGRRWRCGWRQKRLEGGQVLMRLPGWLRALSSKAMVLNA